MFCDFDVPVHVFMRELDLGVLLVISEMSGDEAGCRLTLTGWSTCIPGSPETTQAFTAVMYLSSSSVLTAFRNSNQ